MPGYDLEIKTIQQNWVYADDVDQAMRFIKWLTSLGYACSGPSVWQGGTYVIFCQIDRGVVASTAMGHSVTFTGQYQTGDVGVATLPDIPGLFS